MQQVVNGLETAKNLAAKYYTPRYRKLDRLERFVRGTQYEGMQDFFAGACPLMQRAPAIVFPAVATAIGQHVDFALGDGRFPKLTTGISEDDSGLDNEFGLDEKESKVFDAFLGHLCDAARFRDVCIDALDVAEQCGSVAAILCVRDGLPEIETTSAKSCIPTFDRGGRIVTSLEIKYPYIDIRPDGMGALVASCLLYRRVIDAVADTVYLPALAPIDGSEPSYTPDTVVTHGLGFCPVIWYQFKKGCARADSFDGHAIHEDLLDELHALNMGLSQRYRAALYAGDPQMVEIGVSDEEANANMGRKAQSTVVLADNPEQHYRATEGENVPARKKGAGTVWRYRNPEASVSMLVLPGDALDAIEKQNTDLQDKLSAALGYTHASPERVRGALSGKALGFLYASTTSFVDRVRVDMWDGFMTPALSMLVRMAFVLSKAASSLFVTGLKTVAPILAKFERQVEASGVRWFPPRIQAVWGQYFEPTFQDELFCVQSAQVALDGGLVTRALAVEKLRGIFSFESAAEVVKAIETEQAQKQADDLALMQAAPPPVAAAPSTKPGVAKASSPKPKPNSAGGQ